MADEGKKCKVIGNAAEIADMLPGFHVQSAWSSPEAFSRYIGGRNPNDAWHNSYSENGSDFYGTKTLAEAIQLSQSGWKEGADKAARISALISARVPRSPKYIKYGIAGSTPNIPRAVAGNLFNMRTLDLAKSRRRPVLTLISNMAVNCGVNTESISNHAAVVAALVDQIEEAGFACEVLATATTSSGYGGAGLRVATTVLVKQSTHAVDLKRLSFSLGHAAFYRRLIFGDWGLNKECQELGRGLGSACPLDINVLNEKGIYVIPCSTDKLFEKEDDAMTKGLDYLILNLKVQMCPAFAKQKYSKDELDKMRAELKKLKGGGLFD